MYRLIKLSGTWYATRLRFELDQDTAGGRLEAKDIAELVLTGSPTLVVGDLDDCEEFNIDLEEMEIVD